MRLFNHQTYMCTVLQWRPPHPIAWEGKPKEVRQQCSVLYCSRGVDVVLLGDVWIRACDLCVSVYVCGCAWLRYLFLYMQVCVCMFVCICVYVTLRQGGGSDCTHTVIQIVNLPPFTCTCHLLPPSSLLLPHTSLPQLSPLPCSLLNVQIQQVTQPLLQLLPHPHQWYVTYSSFTSFSCIHGIIDWHFLAIDWLQFYCLPYILLEFYECKIKSNTLT